MVESAKMRKSDDVARVRPMNGPRLRGLFREREMSSRGVVIGAVSAKHSTEMSLIENDMVVKTVSAN